MDKLAFDLTVFTEPERPQHIWINVIPVINDTPLKAYSFDVITVLLLGTNNAPQIDIFTCSCGVAGCAGIDDYASIRVTQDTVTWAFPPEPFRASFPKDMALELTFNREQYAKALKDLIQQIQATREGKDVITHVGPGSDGDGEENPSKISFQDELEVWRAERIDRAAWMKEVAEEEAAEEAGSAIQG